MQNKITCYIAGKLNDDACNYIKNVNLMIKEARKVRNLGCAVYVPCLDILEGLCGGDFEYGDYFNNSQAFLIKCDIVYVCPGWETSNGTKHEIELAIEYNIPVIYDFDELEKIYKTLTEQRMNPECLI